MRDRASVDGAARNSQRDSTLFLSYRARLIILPQPSSVRRNRPRECDIDVHESHILPSPAIPRPKQIPHKHDGPTLTSASIRVTEDNHEDGASCDSANEHLLYLQILYGGSASFIRSLAITI